MTNFKSIAPLAAYIDRIGAEELSFRRFMVKNYKGSHYYQERCLIKIGGDGDITVSNKEFAPTKEEAAAIKVALASANFPKHIRATEANVDVLRSQMKPDSILYVFWDRKDWTVVMVQERTTIDGHKAYVPWTFWSDAEWRRMEPEGALPFWKPKTVDARPGRRIMVHEGAKTAEFVDALVHDEERCRAHPWGAVLKEYEHWGMIGGALAPHRTDYAELRREKPAETIYVCDNDYPGKAALRVVSKEYGNALKGVMFDERWPGSWDLADEMPATMFARDGRYIGPTFDNMLQLATWATELMPNPAEKGRPITLLKAEFGQEWFHSVVPEVFVHKDWPNLIFNSQEFNNRVRPFSDVMDTARLVMSDAASKSAVLKYSPAEEPGIYSDNNGQRYINTHVPSGFKPEEGDVAPFIDFMEHLVPDEQDRHDLMKWCATLIARPDIKMLYGVLMISEIQGIGKGTLGEKILAPLIGEHNVSYPSESEIVESNYNYWAAHKRLAVVHEIYAGQSSKAYNKLKSVVTDRYITVSKKYQANYDIENWVHIFACSNSMRAIQLSGDDRRWFVPKVTELKQPAAYWQRLNDWLKEDGGLNKIKRWAESFVEAHGPVMRGDAAPWSAAKRDIVEDGYSPGMALVAQFLDRAKEEAGDKPVIVLDTDLIQMIKDVLYEGRPTDRLERPATIRKLAKARGWFVGEHRAQVKEWGTRGSWSRIITSNQDVSRRLPGEIAKEHKLMDVVNKAREWGKL
jgi:hypothetical protein